MACYDNLSNRSWYASEDSAVPPPTGVWEQRIASPTLALEPIRPNPFHDQAVISFTLGASGPVRLAIHDVRGRHIETLITGPREAGSHRAVWNANGRRGVPASSGIYFVRLESQNGTCTRSVLLLR